jgi:hypothetical protein
MIQRKSSAQFNGDPHHSLKCRHERRCLYAAARAQRRCLIEPDRRVTAYENWRSLRELDRAAGRSKGAAFRAFKQLNAAYREGRDYIVLEQQRDLAAISELRARGRLYASSVNVVLLAPALADAVLARLLASPET